MSPTAIEWTEETWNPVTGCTKVSAGCDNCYAERITERFHGKGAFDTIVLHQDRIEKPLHWRKPRTVFVNSMSDLFHADVPASFVASVFDVMRATPQHTYQILTKRPGRMRSLMKGGVPGGSVLPNVWLGVSCEDQETADKRIPALVDTPAAVRFISAEPLLGPLSLRWGKWAPWPQGESHGQYDGLRMLDWIIVGGESGLNARPMQPDWARSLRDECVGAGVAFFFKQWGGRTPKANGRELDGETWSQMPAPSHTPTEED